MLNNLSEKDFDKAVKEADQPVVLKFTADW
jgi:thiol:disulfide interchange protein